MEKYLLINRYDSVHLLICSPNDDYDDDDDNNNNNMANKIRSIEQSFF